MKITPGVFLAAVIVAMLLQAWGLAIIFLVAMFVFGAMEN